MHPAQENVVPLKAPPVSVEAEQAVLGGLMLNNDAWDDVVGLVAEADFYRRDHRLIFRAISGQVERGQPFDMVTLGEWLDKQGLLDTLGGLTYLGSLAANTPSAANIKSYAEIVRDRSLMRSMISAANEIADSGYMPEGRCAAELLDEAERKVFALAERGVSGPSFVDMKSGLNAAIQKIEYLFTSGSAITGVPTGFADFDARTLGLQKSDLVIVGGRPSMGKTTFAMNIAENAAVQHEVPVAVFSMEMPTEQLMMRMLASAGRVDLHAIKSGGLKNEDWDRLTSAVGTLSRAPIYVDDSPALSPGEVRSRARRIAREHGLGLIVVDYLQLMRVPGTQENRNGEIAEISRSLKALAKELNVPVIALSQLNRSLEQRPDKRPLMSDLRESGAIEQDADVIVFLYRDEVYNKDSPDQGTAEALIRKFRNGETGTVRLAFLGRHARFESYAGGDFGAANDEGF